jgi:stage III sporulation protein AF
MNSVKEWSVIICMAALAATLLQSLVPSGSMERMVKFIIGAFVICAIIQPLSRVVPEINTSIRDDSKAVYNNHLKDTVDNQISAAAQESVRNLVTAELNKINIKCKNVDTIMDTNEDNSISINKVVVILAKGYGGDCQKALEHLEKTLGLKTEVTVDDGKG